jgi:hypothetical protein
MVVNSKFQSTTYQLFKSCPTHCLCLQLPECLPGDLWHSEQLISWRASCFFLCTVKHDLQLYQHNDGYQQWCKNTSKATTALQRCNLGSNAIAQASHIPSTSSYLGVSSSQPAVSCVGPQVVDLNSQANPSLHPAFTCMNSITSSLRSLLNNKLDNNLTHVIHGFLVSYLLYFAIYCLVILTDDE